MGAVKPPDSAWRVGVHPSRRYFRPVAQALTVADPDVPHSKGSKGKGRSKAVASGAAEVDAAYSLQQNSRIRSMAGSQVETRKMVLMK